MSEWLKYFKSGISHEKAPDRVEEQPLPIKTALKNLLPFIKPHWRLGVISGVMILLTSLLVFPLPMIYRFLN